MIFITATLVHLAFLGGGGLLAKWNIENQVRVQSSLI